MIHDVPFRHQQALDPSSLATFPACFHGVLRGIEDCRNAGLDPAEDPAVALLVRRLARLFEAAGSEAALRAACERRIADLAQTPVLLALALRCVAYDALAKERFHIGGRHALRDLARALDFQDGSYTVTSHPGDPAIAGDVVLTSPDMELTLSIGPLHAGNEVRYHARRGPAARLPLRYAPLRELLKVERFARKVARDLRLAEIPGVPIDAVRRPLNA